MDRNELRRLIKASGLTQVEVADAMGCAYSTITYYLQGRTDPVPPEFAERVMEFLLSKARERRAEIDETLTAAAR